MYSTGKHLYALQHFWHVITKEVNETIYVLPWKYVRYLINLDLIFTAVKAECYVTTEVNLSVFPSVNNMTEHVLTKNIDMSEMIQWTINQKMRMLWTTIGSKIYDGESVPVGNIRKNLLTDFDDIFTVVRKW